MTKKQRALLCVEALKKEYPDAICSLNYKNDFQLLVATRLSAQCTDARVNIVTPALFEKYPTVEAFAEADVADVEEIIRSCGFYRTKAKDIIGMAQKILSDFGGMVPDNIEDLTSLPGVGRKTANLICGDIFGKPAVVADTHLIRISNLLGLVETKDPLRLKQRCVNCFRRRKAMIFVIAVSSTAEPCALQGVLPVKNAVWRTFANRQKNKATSHN